MPSQHIEELLVCCGHPAYCRVGGDCAIRAKHFESDRAAINAAIPAPSVEYKSGDLASGMLREAAEIVAGDRDIRNGHKERSFSLIAKFWGAYIDGRKGGGPLTARNVSDMMILLKIARSIQGTPDRDHFVDMAGYAAVSGELAAQQKEGGF